MVHTDSVRPAEVYPGVVTTIRRRSDGATYEVREPRLTERDERVLAQFTELFQGLRSRPSTDRVGMAC